jgi:hypothetical protein
MLMLKDGAAIFLQDWQQLGIAVAAPRRPAAAAIRLAGAS